jgi:hypothetical protein
VAEAAGEAEAVAEASEADAPAPAVEAVDTGAGAMAAVDAAAQAVEAAVAEPWEAQLPFKIKFLTGVEVDCPDIFEYDRNVIWSDSKVYLHPSKYKSGNGFNSTESDVCGWNELLLDLQKASQLTGEVLVSNGRGGGGKNSRLLKCQRGRVSYTGKEKKKNAANQKCRKQSLLNDRQNSRGPGGKKEARKTATTRSISKDECCKFSLRISFDETGFFFVGGKRKGYHCNHLKKALLAATGGAPSGLTQVTYTIPQDQQGEFDYNDCETKTNDEEDDEDDDNEDDNDNEDRIATERDVYPVLAPIMKDLYALAPQNCTVGQLRKVTSSVETLLMIIKTASYKEYQSKKQPNMSGGSGNDGGCEGSSRLKLISTTTARKIKKTHGTKRKDC